MTQEWTVTLIRQPYLDNVRHKHPDKRSAMERAYALSQLHPNCEVSVIDMSRRIWIHASAWYARKS